jgi:hypothetical protein
MKLAWSAFPLRREQPSGEACPARGTAEPPARTAGDTSCLRASSRLGLPGAPGMRGGLYLFPAGRGGYGARSNSVRPRVARVPWHRAASPLSGACHALPLYATPWTVPHPLMPHPQRFCGPIRVGFEHWPQPQGKQRLGYHQLPGRCGRLAALRCGVIDTITGHVWRRALYAAQGWKEMGSPVSKRDRQNRPRPERFGVPTNTPRLTPRASGRLLGHS